MPAVQLHNRGSKRRESTCALPYPPTGMQAVRLLNDQIELQRCSSQVETDGVLVEATSAPRPASLPPALSAMAASRPGSYFFMYRIRVENRSSEAVQLESRHLQFFDQRGRLFVEVPRGSPGVVGYQPLIPPGEGFEYYSGTELPTPAGPIHYPLAPCSPGGTVVAVQRPELVPQAWF